jgi:hypothetical protein
MQPSPSTIHVADALWLNNTTISIGTQKVCDSDPLFVAGALGNNYDQSLATIKGRFLVRSAKEKVLTELKQAGWILESGSICFAAIGTDP